ncbi:MAG: ABC transporter permease [Clostridiales Family XIII bacterium]|jgi:ribose/xylose/arabinose/galactoside ABC-type transport system permease subunit|nr:ABC transporter permease [Clostridiales Family XIII bacterium]
MSHDSPLIGILKSKLFVLLAFLALLTIVFSVLTEGQFVALLNISNIFQTTSVIGLLAVGAGALMIAGHIDLSAGGVGTMCALLCAVMVRDGAPWWVGVLVSTLLGGLIGLLNAFLINKLHFQSFIATLAMAQVTEGLSYLICNSRPVPVLDEVLTFVGGGRFFGYIPYSVVLIVAAFVVYALLLNRTRFGRSVYLVGANPEASRLAGLRPKRLMYALFANSGALAAIAGILLMSRVGSANATGITKNQFSGITAAVLGGISFGGGIGGMSGAFVGLLILGSFNNAMTLLGMDAYLQTTASGALLVVALMVDFFVVRRGRQRIRPAHGTEGGETKP